MSIKTTDCGWGEGYVVSAGIQDRLVGNILEVVETIGLPEKQEQAIKSLIRQKVWNTFEDAIFITSKRHTEIRNLYWEKRKDANLQGLPMSAI